MGVLTDDMARLRSEIECLRGSRAELTDGLRRGANELKDAVSRMQADLRDAHAGMARTTTADRFGFVSTLKQTVSGLRQDFASDLAGARLAWFGKGA